MTYGKATNNNILAENQLANTTAEDETTENIGLNTTGNDDEMDVGHMETTWKVEIVCQKLMQQHLKAHVWKLPMKTQIVITHVDGWQLEKYLLKIILNRLARIYFIQLGN